MKRLTDAEFRKLINGSGSLRGRPAISLREADRARSEEARLLKENAEHKDRIDWLEKGIAEWKRDCAEKDDLIRTLGDALILARRMGAMNVLDTVDAALRLAGRLP
jgi:hypothetical protein